MKHLLLVFILTNAFILRGYAQQVTLTLTPGIVSSSVNPDSFEVKGKSVLKNTASQTKRFVWQRNIINMTNGWQSLVCDVNQCWTSSVSVSPDTLILAPNGTSNLDVYIRPNHISGAATIELKVTEVGNSANTLTGRYLFSPTTSVRDYSKTSMGIRVFPNPTTDYFMVSDNSDIVEKVVIYNIIGRQMKSYKALDNFKYTVQDLPEGIYIIRLLNGSGNTIKTIRLNKSKSKA
jgi:Secretion system C-terminal sorting domain